MKTAANGARRGNSEVQNLLSDVEELLGRMTNIDDADIRELRQRVTTSVENARESLRSTANRLQDRAMSAAKVADDYAHESPWPVIGVAAVAGLAIGLLASRR